MLDDKRMTGFCYTQFRILGSDVRASHRLKHLRLYSHTQIDNENYF